MGISGGRIRRVLALAIVSTLLPAFGVAESQAATKRTTCSTVDYQNDARLGPKRLPNSGPLRTVLKGYNRFDGMTAKGYLAKYYDEAGKTWRYPPQGGYLLTPEGAPVKLQVTIFAGQRIDRFGSEFGSYLSPEGTPYGARGHPTAEPRQHDDPGDLQLLALQGPQGHSGLLRADRPRPRAAGLRLAVRPRRDDLPRQPAGVQRRLPRDERLPRARHELARAPLSNSERMALTIRHARARYAGAGAPETERYASARRATPSPMRSAVTPE